MSRRLASVGVVALIAVACAQPANLSAFGPQERGAAEDAMTTSWLFDSGTDNGETLSVGDTISLTLAGDRLSGVACNHFGGSVKTSEDGSFRVTDLANTDMYCGSSEVMDAESGFLNALAKVENFVLTDSGLVLSGGGAELRFIPDVSVALPPGGNASDVVDGDRPDSNEGKDISGGGPGQITPGNPGEGESGADPGEPTERPDIVFDPESYGTWTLVEGQLDGQNLPMKASHPATLNISAESIGGGVCNGYSVSSTEAGRFAIGQTLMSCGTEIDEWEAMYLETLTQTEAYGMIDNGRMTLRGATGYLIFERG